MKNFATISLSSVLLICGIYVHASVSTTKSVRNVEKLFATVIGKKFSNNAGGDILYTDADFVFSSEEDEEEGEEGRHLLTSRYCSALFSFLFDDCLQVSKTTATDSRPISVNGAPLYIAQRVLLI